MRILFIGTVLSSKILVRELFDRGNDLVGIVTKEKNNFNSDHYSLVNFAKKNKIDYFIYENDLEELKIFINNKSPDLIYCIGWSHLIPKEIIDIPKYGAIGFHPTKLPNNKGRHPIIWTLVLGLDETASTFFYLDERADSGKIVSQETVQVQINDDAKSLYFKILEIAKTQITYITEQIRNDSLKILSLNNEAGNSWRKREKKDGRIDFRMSAESIFNLVRALNKPYIGAHIEYLNTDYKVWKVMVIKDKAYSNIEPGKVVEVKDSGEYNIKAGDDLISIVKSDPIPIKEGSYL